MSAERYAVEVYHKVRSFRGNLGLGQAKGEMCLIMGAIEMNDMPGSRWMDIFYRSRHMDSWSSQRTLH